jgi:hypothetical protein
MSLVKKEYKNLHRRTKRLKKKHYLGQLSDKTYPKGISMLADTSLNPIYLSKRKLALRLTV